MITAVPARTVLAQTIAAPAPSTEEQRNAAIVKPLVEIGRVRARTPYCAALARARPGIDAALAYEYQAPVLAADLRHFGLDSEFARYRSTEKTQRDLTILYNLARAGRVEVLALRDAANLEGLDDQRRAELLAFANALDGAKARQVTLAKQIARTFARLAETKVNTIVDSSAYDRNSNALDGRRSAATALAGQSTAPVTQTQADALEQHDLTQSIFGAFSSEELIKSDLEIASKHAVNAMQLGGCSAT